MKWMVVLAAMALPAAAEEVTCGPTEIVYGVLGGQFGEHRIGMGMRGDVLVEVWVNPTTGSWTIVTTNAAGVSCLASSGLDFEYVGLPPNT